MSSFKGLDNLFDVLDLVKDPSKYEKKLTELRTEVSRYTEVIESVVKLSEVNDYTTSIREREASSKKILEDAKATSTAITMKASEEAAELDKKSRELAKKAKESASAVAEREASVAEQEKANLLRQKELDAVAVQLDARKAALTLSEQELAAKKEKLAAAMG